MTSATSHSIFDPLKALPGYGLASTIVSGLSSTFIVRRKSFNSDEKTSLMAMNILESSGRIFCAGGAAMVIYHSLPESLPYIFITLVGGAVALVVKCRNHAECRIDISVEQGEAHLISFFEQLKATKRDIKKLEIHYGGSEVFKFNEAIMTSLHTLTFTTLELHHCEIPSDLLPMLTRSAYCFQPEVSEEKICYKLKEVEKARRDEE